MKKRILLLVIMLLMSGYMFAQDPGDFGDDQDPDPLDEPAVPIDLYIEALVLSAALAFYRLYAGKIHTACRK